MSRLQLINRFCHVVQSKVPNKLSCVFCGTQDKCAACKKTVYPLEKMTLEGEPYHKTCFKCAHSGCLLTTASYATQPSTGSCTASTSSGSCSRRRAATTTCSSTPRRRTQTNQRPPRKRCRRRSRLQKP